MVKSFLLRSLLPALLLLVALAGCSNPESHPVTPPPEFVDGDPLDLNATEIYPAPSGRWIVSADWVIPEGRTVTIQPGTVILFDSLWSVDVAGVMNAVGTAAQPIAFSTAFREPEMGQWRGFKLHNPNEGSNFQHCIFTYGAFLDPDTNRPEGKVYKGMLAINNSSPVIERCVVFRNQNNAVYITGPNSHPRIRFNIFYMNDASAVRANIDSVDLGSLTIAYNNAADNSSPSFIVADSSSIYYTRFGVQQQLNANLDSCDYYFNLVNPVYWPMMKDPFNGDFTLESCSPCIDAGSYDTDTYDPDATRADMGAIHYEQVPGELRGVVDGVLDLPERQYRLSCDVRVDAGHTLTIPAGTQIEITGDYQIEVFGRLVIDGTAESPVRFYTSVLDANSPWGGIIFHALPDSVSDPSVVRYTHFERFRKLDVFRAGVEFTGCRFSDGHDYGLNIATGVLDPARAVRIAGCTIERIGEYGIAIDSSAATVRNTHIVGSQGRGISMRWTDTTVIVCNTIVRACSTTGIFAEDFSSPQILNSVFTANGYYGIHLMNNCNPQIRNNIVYANRNRGVYAQYSSQPVLAYNNVYGHTLGGANTDYVPATLPATGSLSVDPLFTADWHLAAGSPCIDAGDPALTDADGSRSDMGAFGGPMGGVVGSLRSRPTAPRLASR